MDDMTTFEHRLADELGAMAGPGRRIDAMAMARSASTRSPRWRFQPLFSATKFVVAGAIVALFGGFLLAGVLTQPSEERAPAAGSTASADPGLTAEPTPVAQASPDLLPGVDLDLDEIEPGVFAVLDDGADHRLRAADTVEVASDMTAWVSTGSRLFQLGRAGSVTTENGGLEPLVAAATHGDLLLVAGRDVLRLESTSGPVRTEEHAPPRPLDAIGPELGGASWATAISAAPDGTAWASWSRGNAINSGDTRLVRFDGEVWEDHSGEGGLGGLIDLTSNGNYICDIESGQGDETWVGVCGAGGWGWGGGGLFRHGESGWEAVSVFADVGRPDVLVSDLVALAAGADGTTWALVFPILAEHADAAADGDWSWADEPATDPFLGSPILARHRDGSWSAYRWDDVSPDAALPINTMSYAGDVLDVDDRGVLWVRAGDTMAGAEVLLSFDGEAVRDYRAVTHIGDLSVDGAGRVWVAARNGLTVIDPSIAAATTREVEALAAPAGTATASTDTATSTSHDLLPGVDLDTDETKPGVHRVASDGATPQIAEAAAARDWSVVDELAAGSAGLPQPGPALLSLRDGAWSAYAWHDLEPDRQRLPWQWDARDALAVDADGVLWFGSAGGSGRPEVMVGSHDGEELRWYPEVVDARDLEIGPDDSPWIAAADGIYVIDLTEAQRDLDGPGPE